LAKKKLAKILLSSMTIISDEVLKILTTSYNNKSYLKLIEIKYEVKLDKLNNLTNRNTRKNNMYQIRKNSKS
jgi:hypothetical protein